MEALIVQALAERKRFRQLKPIVPVDMLTPEINTTLAWIEYYFSAFPEAEHVILEDLIATIKLRSTSCCVHLVQLPYEALKSR